MQHYMYLDPGGPSGQQLQNMAFQSPCMSLYYATHPACSSWFPYAGTGHNPGIHNPYMPPQCGVGMCHAQPFAMPGPYSGMEQSRLGCPLPTVLDSGPMVGGVSGLPLKRKAEGPDHPSADDEFTDLPDYNTDYRTQDFGKSSYADRLLCLDTTQRSQIAKNQMIRILKLKKFRPTTEGIKLFWLRYYTWHHDLNFEDYLKAKGMIFWQIELAEVYYKTYWRHNFSSPEYYRGKGILPQTG